MFMENLPRLLARKRLNTRFVAKSSDSPGMSGPHGNKFVFFVINVLIFFIPLFCTGITAYAVELPPSVVKGRVTDTAGNPLAGATVILKGTTKGISTNENGEFSIQSPKGTGILVISYTGYTSREISFSGNATLDIKLSTADNKQSDIVVIGYGTQRDRKSVV